MRVNKQRTIIAPNGTVRIVVPAQADTGANVTATNDITLIFHYMPYETPEPVEVFAASAGIHAVGQGFMKVVSDEGHVMDWPVV